MKFKKIKNILEFILNAIFSLLAVYLLVLLLFPNINFIETNSFYLIVIIEIYLVVFLLINTFKDIFSKVFPRYLSFLVAFFLYYYSQYIFFYFKFDNPDIIYLNSVFTIYIFIQYLIFKNIKYNKKIKFPDKSIFKWNYII
ncbi:MAG: hypothetical protein JXA16_14545, partial [Bacteroidales bacterium]|nr:hypothetical protein [Bacteroidales bacterium]